MTIKHDCSGTAYDKTGFHRCFRNATVQRDGQWWCWQHDPGRVKADREKRRAGWEAKMDKKAAKYARLARNAKLGKLVTPGLAALLEALAGSIQYFVDSDDSPNSLPVRAWRKNAEAARALATRIREVLDDV